MNKKRLADRNAAHDNGKWVRDAADAYNKKKKSKVA
jgi:hypothetical protein